MIPAPTIEFTRLEEAPNNPDRFRGSRLGSEMGLSKRRVVVVDVIEAEEEAEEAQPPPPPRLASSIAGVRRAVDECVGDSTTVS
mmetsp:Transcript_15387/g.35677  ORF Transcript_15387/g.35677 Transcript_15387/m.35677 type:complete len:84 (+) Transcript_15387:2004-2255(+)